MAYTYSDLAALRVPDGAAADDVAAHLSFLVEQIDPMLQGMAYSAADRDSKFFMAPAGYFCKVVNPPTDPTAPDELIGIYIKTAKAGLIGWYPLYEPFAAYTEYPISIVDGFEPRASDRIPTITVEDPHWAVLSGAFQTSGGSGNITFGTKVAYLDPHVVPLRPAQDFPCSLSYNASNAGVGRVAVTASDGGLAYWGPPTTWFALDGVRIQLAV